jgi:hypothetical protein
MNITPQFNQIPIATVVNPPTDSLRRENNLREVIAQPAAMSQSAAEKGVASDKDRAKNPGQTNDQIDFSSLLEQAEAENNTVSEQDGDKNNQQNAQQNKNEVSEQRSDASRSQDSDSSERSPQHEIAEEFAKQQEITQLQLRDREVRTHELAHASVGGVHTGAPSYSFTVGPDGKQYATDGEVSVDLSTIAGDPQATITKLKKVYAAALAPAEPSPQDIKVAAQAAQLVLQAQSELLAEKFDDQSLAKDSVNNVPNNGEFRSDNTNTNKNSVLASDEFDHIMNQTLQAQEHIAPSRSDDINARSSRIENFYGDISNAYTKPDSFRFELTA